MIKAYVKSPSIDKMLAISKASNEEDIKANCDKLIAAIREIGLQIHVGTDELFSMQNRDYMLFIY